MGPCDCAEAAMQLGEGELLEGSHSRWGGARIQPDALPTAPHLAERSPRLISARLGRVGGDGWQSPHVCARGRVERCPTIKGKLPRPQTPWASQQGRTLRDARVPTCPSPEVTAPSPLHLESGPSGHSPLGLRPGARDMLAAPAPPEQQAPVWTEGSDNWAQ